MDIEADGERAGVFSIPYSSDSSASGRIAVPVLCARRGEGPTAVFLAGTHGDEVEGQIALRRLWELIPTLELNGRVIILPGANWPAVLSGSRLSPLDRGNLFRSYGLDGVGPTAAIADRIAKELLPLADIIVDFHSGGSTLEFQPCVISHVAQDHPSFEAAVTAAAASTLPLVLRPRQRPSAHTLYGIAQAASKVVLATELGGGSINSRNCNSGLDVALGILRHIGILPDPPSLPPWLDAVVDGGDDAAIFASMDALFEPCVSAGEAIKRGQIICRLYPLNEGVGQASVEVAAEDCVVVARRALGRARPGDCLFEIGSPHRIQLRAS